MNDKNQNIIGNKYGRLTVQKLAYKKSRRLYYTCLCKCGCKVDVRKDQLTRGVTKSCGCLQKDIAKKTMAKSMKKYGLSNHPLNRVFNSMKQRCYNKNNKGFKHYGGRGISICNEWINDFKAFYNWAIENGYKSGLSIDRIDVNGNYTPKNCRFVSMKIQNINKESNVFIEYKGETRTLSEWCDKLNLKYTTTYMRLNRGWDVEKAFSRKLTF